MRERIAASFVLVAVVLIALVVTIRVYSLQGFLREQEQTQQQRETALVAVIVDQTVDAGRPVDEQLLRELVGVESRLEYDVAGQPPVVAEGRAFDADMGVISAAAEAGDGSVELLTTVRELSSVSARQLTSIVVLALLFVLLAGLAGWWVASRLAAPFQRLAVAAEGLGRGRVDVEVPQTRVPEARAIAQALRAGSAQLATRLEREREFAEYASHELRTPLTALQLELEDLAMRDDVPDDARATARRGLQRVRDVDAAAGRLVAITRQGALVEGGQVALGELATQVTQSWADRLGTERRPVTAQADGDLDLTYTPGPVEHVLELLLDEVVGGEGPVRLAFEGNPSHLKVEVPAGIASPPPHPGLTEARELAEQQGGRVTGDLTGTGVTVWMPRR
jgi:signal transduction histidine kinase